MLDTVEPRYELLIRNNASNEAVKQHIKIFKGLLTVV